MANKKTAKTMKRANSSKGKKAKTGSAGARRNAPLVVSYGVDWESTRGGFLDRVIRELGFSSRRVQPEELSCTVGALAGLPGYRVPAPPYAEEPPQDEFLLLCNLDKQQLDDFLMASKIVGASIPHKAVLTRENREWTFAALMEQVAEEHQQLVAAKAEIEASAQATDATQAADDAQATNGAQANHSAQAADDER